MEPSLLVSLIIAVVAIVPGIWSLIIQARKDVRQAQTDMSKAAHDAALSIIGPLQSEVSRLQTRVLDLETLLINKTNEIGELRESNIDKDSEIRTLKYTIADMEQRLRVFENKRFENRRKNKEEDEAEPHPINPDLEKELKINAIKKEEIKLHTAKTIEHITSSSVSQSMLKEDNINKKEK